MADTGTTRNALLEYVDRVRGESPTKQKQGKQGGGGSGGTSPSRESPYKRYTKAAHGPPGSLGPDGSERERSLSPKQQAEERKGGRREFADPLVNEEGQELDPIGVEFDTSEISPELAVQVLRHYLLPMFEAHQAAASAEIRQQSPASGLDPSTSLDGMEDQARAQGGMYGELKLSDILMRKLDLCRDEMRQSVISLRERLTSTEADRSGLEDKVAELTKNFEELSIELKMTSFQETAIRNKAEDCEAEVSMLRQQVYKLETFLRQHQETHAKLCHQVYEQEVAADLLQRNLASMRNANALNQLENDVMAEQVRNLHTASETLADMKGAQDELKHLAETSESKLQELHDYREKLEDALWTLAKDREMLLEVRRDLTVQKENLTGDKGKLERDLERERGQAKQELVELFDQKETIRKELSKMDKKMREVNEDRDKLKQRLKKMRQRRRVFEQEQKVCKNCSREYMESENFNWSCRTHQSEFGGEMWWCCGKLGKDAAGCKFAKHESKDDDDELDEQEKKEKEEHERRLRNQNVRCFSCKETGHKAKDCPADPNPRNNVRYAPAKEIKRIELLGKTTRENTRIQSGFETGKTIAQKMGNDSLEDHFPMDEKALFEDLRQLTQRREGVLDLDLEEEDHEDEDERAESYEESDDLPDEESEHASNGSEGGDARV
uniref:CCHC-type domain-containing protein n=1 Tax=Chromera velia CCMP2878 TaxID=1169474 RepID=A0A0G4IAN3_9ALVE|eukprot:Cvel_2102.t1-p1 / transcript=Cvel_2102.t1 / gene=Cvel_2102 / organism=Chromera_velia_CCMP2878 / gene_product=Myosin-15, putative / transcript_product=Myosin-15, putative / location=Cvel_scaffold81:41768-49962(-) / protein_length=669 / sequence_SO=supercontig / SO=protein_coding / is_pseudo=false